MLYDSKCFKSIIVVFILSTTDFSFWLLVLISTVRYAKTLRRIDFVVCKQLILLLFHCCVAAFSVTAAVKLTNNNLDFRRIICVLLYKPYTCRYMKTPLMVKVNFSPCMKIIYSWWVTHNNKSFRHVENVFIQRFLFIHPRFVFIVQGSPRL